MRKLIMLSFVALVFAASTAVAGSNFCEQVFKRCKVTTKPAKGYGEQCETGGKCRGCGKKVKKTSTQQQVSQSSSGQQSSQSSSTKQGKKASANQQVSKSKTTKTSKSRERSSTRSSSGGNLANK